MNDMFRYDEDSLRQMKPIIPKEEQLETNGQEPMTKIYVKEVPPEDQHLIGIPGDLAAVLRYSEGSVEVNQEEGRKDEFPDARVIIEHDITGQKTPWSAVWPPGKDKKNSTESE